MKIGIFLCLCLLALQACGSRLHKLGGKRLHFPQMKVGEQDPDPAHLQDQYGRPQDMPQQPNEAAVFIEENQQMEAEANSGFECKSVWGKNRQMTKNCPSGYTMVGGGGRQNRRHWDRWSNVMHIKPHGNGYHVNVGRWGSQVFLRCCKIPQHACRTVSRRRYWWSYVHCPRGTVMTGGGIGQTWNRWWFHGPIKTSAPHGNGWWGWGWHQWITAYARCCKNRVFGSCYNAGAGWTNRPTAYCAKSHTVTGGGWHIAHWVWSRLSAWEESYAAGDNAWVVDSGYGYGWTYTIARCCVKKADVNLCQFNNGGCDKLTKCKYSVGTYLDTSCGACPKGYTGKGKSGCNDINECQSKNGGCHKLTKCTNTPGSRDCGPCPEGYTGNGVSGCVDIDECKQDAGGCDKLTKCVNTPGSYYCTQCPTGYKKHSGIKPCVDINECKVDNGGCDLKTTCTNTPGSRTCSDCGDGYSGNGADENGCQDINECSYANGGCDKLTKCQNRDGSFSCGPCPTGYRGNPLKGCKDVNECKTNNGNCHPKRTCVNQNGGRLCDRCALGFRTVGEEDCEDVNECNTNNGGCDPLTRCLNRYGSRSCGGCPKGYEGSGEGGCHDINECKENNGGCDKLTLCINTPGSRECGVCPPGYVGEGADECINAAESAKWQTTSKLDVAKVAAKNTADVTVKQQNLEAQEQDADRERRENLLKREKAISELDEKVTNLKWKSMLDQRKRKAQEAMLKTKEAKVIVAGAQQKVKNMFTEALTQEVKQKNQQEAMKAAVPDTKSSGAQGGDAVAAAGAKPEGSAAAKSEQTTNDKSTATDDSQQTE